MFSASGQESEPPIIETLEEVYRGRRIRLTRDRVRVVGRPTMERETVRHPGAVSILPVLDENRLVLIENFRHTVGRSILEIPAGTLEPDEPPEECAYRELLEETGYRAKEMNFVRSFYTTPGFTDERMWFFVARDLTLETPDRDPGEWIQVRIVTREDVEEMLEGPHLVDAKTILALQWWQFVYSGRKK